MVMAGVVVCGEAAAGWQKGEKGKRGKREIKKRVVEEGWM